ncbi:MULTISPECIES: nucleotidyltransferase family protein [Methylomonas]|uniref:4-diphosphocytidyl-2C-methyl-D-erythritol kinase n=2 Tax=Methylomonas TaxID=416 RepID=A0A140E761_9GAMM|nr:MULTISPECIES: nucleotidyltransferase family protein [Methylomonas]AMK79235.1 4-diphosphocytidyl-2C-methyl-D-erythritol kinase [Methylomonas denitrificans]OAH98136.1 4-diphosphocytidyl-2C-methyl-D-erythritol kinase [Methylomonas methanica]TCV86246.1 molybdenum cofactor cytidylyltransferase [Methylomonas methanica]
MHAAIDNVYAVILAAGASSRMGSPKQLLIWQDRPLLTHALANAQAVLAERIVVVLGANAEAIKTAIDLNDVSVALNPDWAYGMAGSIRAGIEALPATAGAVLLMLCDQPLINAAHLQNLVQAWQHAPERIVVSQYAESFGVPAVFPAAFFAQLAGLTGDRGAKPLLMQFEESLVNVPFREAELDIDTQGDYLRLHAHKTGAADDCGTA